MDFSDKLKDIRKNEGLSQEQLAERIGVSRQAITKWETGKGLPDFENMLIIAEIFKMTLDELVSNQSASPAAPADTYVSESIYDIDRTMHFDMHVGVAKRLRLTTSDDEKLHVKLLSSENEKIGSVLKVKFDENKNRLDVDCVNKDKMTRFEAEESLQVEIYLPRDYTDHCEVAASVVFLDIDDLALRRLEYDGDAEFISISKSAGSLEFTAKTNYDITVDEISGRIDVNQWKAKTVVHIPADKLVRVVNKGRKCSVEYKHDGEIVSDPAPVASGDNEITVSGMFSDLLVDLV